MSNRWRVHPEPDGDTISYLFDNGLIVMAERGERDDPLRILPLGPIQDAVLGFVQDHPECARGKTVFEPFAGSGAFALMALHVGAGHADLVDVNPRAREFQLRGAARSGIRSGAIRCITASVEAFRPAAAYDLVLANPPFIPTPDGIAGTLSSNGGPDGNRFAAAILDRLDEFLNPGGQLVMCLFQVCRAGLPLIAEAVRDSIRDRVAELSPLQRHPVLFSSYCDAYERQHPEFRGHIHDWRKALTEHYGTDLTLMHYLLHIAPAKDHRDVVVRTRPAARFGSRYVIQAGHPDAAPVDGQRR